MAATGSGGAGATDKGSPCPGVRGSGVLRAPSAGDPAVLAVDDADVGGAAFTADYRGEVYLFAVGAWARFGRDDACVHLPVWEQLRGTALSRVAGELWCLDAEEMWVRNLSTAHELVVSGPDGPPQLLGPRRDGERGRACSLPVPEGVVSGPSTGDWRITVRRQARTSPVPAAGAGDEAQRTRAVGPVPPELLPVAAALCAPLLTRSGPPASYEQVAALLGLTPRQVRRRVDRLCEHYREQVPDLLPASAAAGQSLYAPLAALLVDRGRVTREDLAGLRTDAPGGG